MSPMRHGGLGLRLADRMRGAASWAAWADALPLIVRRFHSARESKCHSRRETPASWSAVGSSSPTGESMAVSRLSGDDKDELPAARLATTIARPGSSGVCAAGAVDSVGAAVRGQQHSTAERPMAFAAAVGEGGAKSLASHPGAVQDARAEVRVPCEGEAEGDVDGESDSRQTAAAFLLLCTWRVL